MEALREPQLRKNIANQSRFTKKFSNAVYHGEMRNGKMHGYGCLRWNNGKIHIGEFYDDKIEGRGCSITPNGGKCSGTFRNFKVHGWARIEAEDGGLYEGNLVDGKRHGYGVLSWEGHRYEGTFEDDERHGKGKQWSHGRWTNVEYKHGLIMVQLSSVDDSANENDSNLYWGPSKMNI